MLAHDLAKKLLEGPNIHIVQRTETNTYLPAGDMETIEVRKWEDSPCEYSKTGFRSFRQMSPRALGDPPGIEVIIISYSPEENADWFNKQLEK